MRKTITVRKRDQKSSSDIWLFPDLKQDMEKISQEHPSYHTRYHKAIKDH